MNDIEPPLSAAVLRYQVAGLTGRLSNDARRGDHYAYAQTQAELRTTKNELATAESRERNEAAAAARLKADRARSGLDADGTLTSNGYSTAGDLIADLAHRGPVVVGVERYLRDAGITPPRNT